MRAIHIAEPRKIEFLDAPKPEPADGEVLVQCSHVALCGSNMGQYTGEGVWAELEYPNPTGWAGHENIGRVVESRCEGFEPGTLVLAQPEGYFGFAEFICAKPPGIARLPAEALPQPVHRQLVGVLEGVRDPAEGPDRARTEFVAQVRDRLPVRPGILYDPADALQHLGLQVRIACQHRRAVPPADRRQAGTCCPV